MCFARKMAICLALLSVCGCVASKDELSVVQRDVDEMKGRLYTMNKDLAQVHGEVKEGVEKSLVGYQKDVQANQKEIAAIRKGNADVQASLDATRLDMQVLSGKVDDLRVLAQKPADDLQLLRDDLAKRLSAMEERLGKVEKSLADEQKKGEAAQQTPDRLYQQGVDSLKGGDAAKAREAFSAFLERYPKHQLAASAHYWTGESYYSEKNYEQAILEFQEVIKSGDKERTPAAMLKQGVAFRELGDAKSAGFVWKKLVEDYPRSEEAKTAKQMLKGDEGKSGKGRQR